MDNNLTSELVSGLIGAFVGATVSAVGLYANYRSSLDSISGWRSKLFDAASADEITLKEVQVMRTALRYATAKEVKENTFAWISNIMIYYSDFITLKYSEPHEPKSLLYQEQEIIRGFIRCLLKNHWEYNVSMVAPLKFLKDSYSYSKPRGFIRETFENANNICKTLGSDHEEYDLLERINKKMVEKAEEQGDKNQSKTNRPFTNSFLEKYVRYEGISKKRLLWCKTLKWGILILGALIVLCLAGENGYSFKSNDLIRKLAIILVILLVIRDIGEYVWFFLKKPTRKMWDSLKKLKICKHRKDWP